MKTYFLIPHKEPSSLMLMVDQDNNEYLREIIEGIAETA
jgi:hypothetical protein